MTVTRQVMEKDCINVASGPVSEIPGHNHSIVIPSPCLLNSEVGSRGPAVKIILGDSERSE